MRLAGAAVADRDDVFAAGPRRIWRRVMAERQPSTAWSQEAEVGVKWNVQRG